MAKTQVMDWKAFMQGEIKKKNPAPIRKDLAFLIPAAVFGGLLVASGLAHAAIPAVVPAADFGSALHLAAKPIKDLLFGFGHEIYGVFMAWGAIEVMIGRANQGFTRMKTATLAYVLLWWVPFIVEQVSKVRPL